MDRGVCQAIVHGITQSDTTERARMHTKVKDGDDTGCFINECTATGSLCANSGKKNWTCSRVVPPEWWKTGPFIYHLLNLIAETSLEAQWQRVRLPRGRYKRGEFSPWVEKIPWKRAWQPTPVFLPGESPWTEEPGGLLSMGHKESEQLSN